MLHCCTLVHNAAMLACNADPLTLGAQFLYLGIAIVCIIEAASCAALAAVLYIPA